MVWTSLSPDGSKSVKQNQAPMAANTVYTESTLNNDHFWNIGTDEDGYHRKISMMNYAETATGAPADPTIPTGLDGVIYLKTANGTVQGFYRNVVGIYQFIPGFLSGTVNLSGSIQNILIVPNNTYGQIYLFINGSQQAMGFGIFKAGANVCQAYCMSTAINGSTNSLVPFIFGNGTQSSGLFLRVGVLSAPVGTYQYRITYWEI